MLGVPPPRFAALGHIGLENRIAIWGARGVIFPFTPNYDAAEHDSILYSLYEQDTGYRDGFE